MAKPKQAPPRPLPPPRPATAKVPRPRNGPQVATAEPSALGKPMVEGRVTQPVPPAPRVPPAPPMPPMPPASAWARSWQALAYILAFGLVVLGFVDLSHPVLGQDDAPTNGPESMPVLSFYPPVPLPADSSYVETVVLPSGDLKVTHWIYSRLPLSNVSLTVPELNGLQSGHVVATGVEVAADGRVVSGAASVDTRRRYQVLGASSVYVTYLLAGALERSASAEGRALARVTSLEVSYASGGGTSTRIIEGADVLALTCLPVADPDATAQPCGSPGQGRWRVELRGDDRDDRVMAQLDLG